MTESSPCESVRLAAMAASDNESSAVSPDELQRHLQGCEECRVALGQLSSTDEMLKQTRRRRHEVDVWPAVSAGITRHRRGERPARSDQPRQTDSEKTMLHPGRRSIAVMLAVSVVLVAIGVRAVILVPTQPESTDGLETGSPIASTSTPKPYEVPYGPAKHVDPEEFRRRFQKYFTDEYQQQQKTALSERTDAGHWRPVSIGVDDGPLGTLFIDDAGKVALASQYALVDSFSEGLAMVGTTVSDVSVVGGYGFIDKTGQLVIPGIYQDAGRFSDGLAVVKKEGKYGYIDQRGTVVVDFKYRQAEAFQDGTARCLLDSANVNTSLQFIDKTGKVLYRTRADDIGRFSEGLLFANVVVGPVKIPKDPTRDQEAPERVVGYMNPRFEFEIRINREMPGDRYFLQGEEFHEGLAEVAFGHAGGERKGFISREGELVIEGNYLQVQPFSDGLAAVSQKTQPEAETWASERWGFIDKTGKMVIKPQFLWTEGFRNGKAAVIVELEESTPTAPLGKWGFIDQQGKLVIQPVFYRASNFQHGLARVEDNPFGYGYINEAGEYVWRLDAPAY